MRVRDQRSSQVQVHKSAVSTGCSGTSQRSAVISGTSARACGQAGSALAQRMETSKWRGVVAIGDGLSELLNDRRSAQ